MFQPNASKLGSMTIHGESEDVRLIIVGLYALSLDFARTVVIKAKRKNKCVIKEKKKKNKCVISVLLTKISVIKLSFVYLIII